MANLCACYFFFLLGCIKPLCAMSRKSRESRASLCRGSVPPVKYYVCHRLFVDAFYQVEIISTPYLPRVPSFVKLCCPPNLTLWDSPFTELHLTATLMFDLQGSTLAGKGPPALTSGFDSKPYLVPRPFTLFCGGPSLCRAARQSQGKELCKPVQATR